MTYTFKLARRMASNHPGVRLLPILAMALLAACGGETATGPTPPPTTSTAGVLTLELTSPNANDGAVQLAIAGPGIDSVRALGYEAAIADAPNQRQMILTGAITTGAVARVYVRDLARAGEYRAWVVAAAARSSYQLQDVSAYRALLVR